MCHCEANVVNDPNGRLRQIEIGECLDRIVWIEMLSTEILLMILRIGSHSESKKTNWKAAPRKNYSVWRKGVVSLHFCITEQIANLTMRSDRFLLWQTLAYSRKRPPAIYGHNINYISGLLEPQFSHTCSGYWTHSIMSSNKAIWVDFLRYPADQSVFNFEFLLYWGMSLLFQPSEPHGQPRTLYCQLDYEQTNLANESFLLLININGYTTGVAIVYYILLWCV